MGTPPLPTASPLPANSQPAVPASTAKVDCCAAGASPYGVFNMAGNVYEWCEDTYDGKYYATSPDRNPVNRGKGRYKVLRGGAHAGRGGIPRYQ